MISKDLNRFWYFNCYSESQDDSIDSEKQNFCHKQNDCTKFLPRIKYNVKLVTQPGSI